MAALKINPNCLIRLKTFHLMTTEVG